MIATSTIVVAAFIGAAAVASLAGVWAYHHYYASVDDHLDQLAASRETIQFDPPTIHRTPLDYFRVMRHLQRGTKLAKKGYVKWYRIDSQIPHPVWVKPTQDGQGTPKHTVDGQPYYFPKDSMITDERTGAWVAVHREGEGDPINLRDPAYPGIETDLVERIINLEAEDQPSSGLFDGLDFTTQQMVYGSIGLLFAVYVGYMYYTGAI